MLTKGVIERVSGSSNLNVSKVITPPGTTGDRTINATAGSVNLAAAASSLTVTNNLVTANSVVLATVASADVNLFSVQAIAGSGSFVVTGNAPADAETRVNFVVFN